MTSKVELYIYDLSRGMAASISPMLIGKRIDGIWHTSIVVYEREYFFGSGGVESCTPGSTALGSPLEVILLGHTQVPYSVFFDYLNGLSESTYAAHTYRLFTHNCNDFSNEIAYFLCNVGIPDSILQLPDEILQSKLAPVVQELLWQAEQSARPIIEENPLERDKSDKDYGHNYKLLTHNCNVFSNDIAQFLCGASIPKHILDLPNEILQTRLTPLIEGFVSKLEQSARPLAEERTPSGREGSPDFEALNSEVEATRYHSFILQEKRKTLAEKQAKRERKREKKRKKLLKQGQTLPPELEVYVSVQDMADTETVNGATESQLPSEQALQMEEDERREEEERKKAREPPIVYRDTLDIRVEFDALVGLIDGKLSPEEQTSLEELHKYMLEDEGSWALGDSFLLFVGRLLNDASLPTEVKVRTLNVLGLAALKDDVILLLHQDRRDHIIMNYAYEVDRISPEEQESLALFIANMFENLSSSEWLMYISEWTYNNQTISNIRVTTKVGVHSLLSDRPALQDRGTAIIHNLACKEVKTVVFDDVAVELTMALLQFFNSKPSEEHLFRSMKALSKFVQVSRQEVPQLIQMIGPDPKTFKGTSPRIDELIDEISSKIR